MSVRDKRFQWLGPLRISPNSPLSRFSMRRKVRLALPREARCRRRFERGSRSSMRGRAGRCCTCWPPRRLCFVSDTGQELAADPVRIGFPDSATLKATSSRPVDELRYDEAERAAAMRRRDLLLGPANRPRTTAEVTATAEALGLTPRGVWALLQRMRVRGDGIAQFLPARHAPRAKRPNARAEAIIQQAIDQHFARRTRASLSSLVGEIAGRCRAAGFAAPCLSGRGAGRP